MDYLAIEEALIGLIERYRGKLPDERVECMIDLTRHNEAAVAFEILCDNLGDVDYEISVDKDTLAALRDIGNLLKVDAKYCDWLEHPRDSHE